MAPRCTGNVAGGPQAALALHLLLLHLAGVADAGIFSRAGSGTRSRTSGGGLFGSSRTGTGGSLGGGSLGRQRFSAFVGGAAVGYMGSRMIHYNRDSSYGGSTDFGSDVCTAKVPENSIDANVTTTAAPVTVTATDSSGNETTSVVAVVQSAAKIDIYWECGINEECDVDNISCKEKKFSWLSLVIPVCIVLSLVLCCALCCCGKVCASKHSRGQTTPMTPPDSGMNGSTTVIAVHDPNAPPPPPGYYGGAYPPGAANPMGGPPPPLPPNYQYSMQQPAAMGNVMF